MGGLLEGGAYLKLGVIIRAFTVHSCPFNVKKIITFTYSLIHSLC